MTNQLTPTPQFVQAPLVAKGSNGLAVAGFVLALLGALTSFIPLVNIFGDFLAVLGLIFGIIGLAKSRSKGAGKGLSIAAIILAVVAFVISIMVNAAAAAVVSSISTTPTALASAEASIAAAAPAAPSAAKAAPGIGSKVVDGKFEFTVTKVERIGKTLSVAEFMPPVTAQGEFIVVRINVKNVGNESQTLSTFMSQKMLTADGKTFDCSQDVTSMKGVDSAGLMKGINPGNSVTNQAVLFDMPLGAKITAVELHDSPFSGGVKVAIK